MLPYAGYVDPDSTLAIGVHHDGHLEATERTFYSLYHTFMFPVHPFALLLRVQSESNRAFPQARTILLLRRGERLRRDPPRALIRVRDGAPRRHVERAARAPPSPRRTLLPLDDMRAR